MFGAQFVLTFFYFFLYFLKGRRTIKKEFQEYFQSLEQDGFVIVPNFLSTKDYRQVKTEFEQLKQNFQKSETYTNVPLPHVERMDLDDPQVSNFSREIFQKNPLIISIAQTFLRRKKLLNVTRYFTQISIRNAEETKRPQDGGTTNLHIDAPLRVLKFFYFFESVSKENGTLEYVRGSNRRGLKILWLEYLHSIRYASNKHRPHPNGRYDKGKPWVEVSDYEVEKYQLHTTSINVPGNTLVILNPGGYHRRGVMTRIGTRKSVEISFRNVDTLRNYFKAFWT